MVDRREMKTGARPHVRVEGVRQDLRVLGHDEETLLVQGGLMQNPEDDLVTLQAQGSLRLTVPREATLEIAQVGGELQLEGVKGEVYIGKVGGDAGLNDGGRVVADRIGGDMLGHDLSARVTFKAVGGDVALRKLEGGVQVLAVGGDLSLRDVAGPVEAAAGGDAHVVLRGPLGGGVKLSAGGDVFCRLPDGPSASVELSAGGELRVDRPDKRTSQWGRASFQIGEGEHDIRIDAGGDLWLGVGDEAEAEVDLDSLGADLASKVGEKIAEMEAALSAMGAEMGAVSSDRIARRVQHLVDRAIRARRRTDPPRGLQEALSGLGGRPEPVSDEERMKVLRLLEQKKINVEEAEKLLDALEG